MFDTVECPYCEYENDMSDGLIDLPSDNRFDTECENCEKEFEVEVEFEPSYSGLEIVYKKCEECGNEDRDYKEKGRIIPFPESSSKEVLCHSCFIKFLGMDYRKSGEV